MGAYSPECTAHIACDCVPQQHQLGGTCVCIGSGCSLPYVQTAGNKCMAGDNACIPGVVQLLCLCRSGIGGASSQAYAWPPWQLLRLV